MLLIPLTCSRSVNFPGRLDRADSLHRCRLLASRGAPVGRPGRLPTAAANPIGSARVMLARVVSGVRRRLVVVVLVVADGLGEVVLDDEERGELELGRSLAHFADYILVARVDNSLRTYGLPLECPELLLAA